MKREQYRALGRDLYFDLPCGCVNPRHDPTQDVTTPFYVPKEYRHILKGYADNYFFDEVNAAPRIGKCQCGRSYQVQWFRDGIEAEWLPSGPSYTE